MQPVSGSVDWKFKEQALPSGGYTGQCCFWASEFLLNTALGTLMPPGKIQTRLDAAHMVTTYFISVNNLNRLCLRLALKQTLSVYL